MTDKIDKNSTNSNLDSYIITYLKVTNSDNVYLLAFSLRN